MSFAWPFALPLLLLPAALVALYVADARRRRRATVLYSDLSLIRAAAPRRPGWRRHLPVALLASALALLGLAVARPQARLDIPISSSTVILAVDVSGSMCATDVDPNRLTAAQTAVREFVSGQSDQTRIGLVVFSGFAQLAVPPTTDRDQLTAAIDGLTVGRGTTIGAAILTAVDAIAEIDPNVDPVSPADGLGGQSGDPQGDGGQSAPAPAPDNGRPEGQYVPEIVVLLTDGANTRGITAPQAAEVAAARGVRVYPIGFGTTNPTRLVCSAEQLGGMRFEGQGATPNQIRRSFLVVDEPSLRQVAETTGGTYHAASDAGQLTSVLENLPRQVSVQHRTVELSAALAGLALLLTLAAVAAAARWTAFPA